MYVDTSQFHAISSITDFNTRILTFLVKRNYFPSPDIFVLSKKPDIQSIKDVIRPATNDERQAMYQKLQQVLTSCLYQ